MNEARNFWKPKRWAWNRRGVLGNVENSWSGPKRVGKNIESAVHNKLLFILLLVTFKFICIK